MKRLNITYLLIVSRFLRRLDLVIKIFKKIGFSHILGGGYVVSFTHYAKGLIGVFLYLKLRSKGKVKYYT